MSGAILRVVPGWLKAFSVATWALSLVGWLIVAAIIYSVAAQLAGGNTPLTILLALVGAGLVVGFLVWVVRIQEQEQRTSAETAETLGLHRIADDFANALRRQARDTKIEPDALAAAEDVLGDVGSIRLESRVREMVAGGSAEDNLKALDEAQASMKAQIEQIGKPAPQHRFFLLDWPRPWFRELFWGTRHGNLVRVFQYTQEGDPRRTFSCVMTDIRPVQSPVVIARGKIVFRPDVLSPPQQSSGDPAFDRTFRVFARNAEVGRPILDARVRGWLLQSAPDNAAFELNGDRLLCRATFSTGPKLVELVDKAEEFTLVIRSVL